METANQLSNDESAWRLVMTVLSMLQIPGIAFMNSGLVRKKSALLMITLPFMTHAVTIVVWFAAAYSLAFSPSGSAFIGDLRDVGLRNTIGDDDPNKMRISDLLAFVRQAQSASVSAAIVTGATAERGKVLFCLLFISLWNVVVYVPIAHWVWSSEGWLYGLRFLDVGGGTAVHICAGVTGAVYALAIGPRQRFDTNRIDTPHNIPLFTVGAFCFLIGQIGASTSGLSSVTHAIKAFVHLQLAACTGGISWILVDFYLIKRWSVLSLSSGFIVGSIAMISAASLVPTWASLLCGLVAGIMSSLATRLKYLVRIDDSLDIFAVHVIPGALGIVFTGLFAKRTVFDYDGAARNYPNGAGGLDGHWIQLGTQLAGVLAATAWSFISTSALVCAFEFARRGFRALKWDRAAAAFSMKVCKETEVCGIDENQVGDSAYEPLTELGGGSEDPAEQENKLTESQTDLQTSPMTDPHSSDDSNIMELDLITTVAAIT